MRWNKSVAVLIAFAFGFTAGNATGRLSGFNEQSHLATVVAAPHSLNRSAPQTLALPAPSVSFVPVQGFIGFNVTRTATLRERPDANAPVIERLRLPEYDAVEILEATGNFLRVRFPANEGTTSGETRESDHEGWVTWSEVTPEMSAIVLDARSGELVTRVPLGSEVTSAVFSPDAGRVVFHSPSLRDAYEAQTGDFALTRMLRIDSERASFTGVFYGGASHSLYAIATQWLPHLPNESPLNESWLLNVSLREASQIRSAISAREVNFIASPDGSLGFILRREEADGHQVGVDVLDLRTMNTRNSFTLQGVSSGSYSFNVNRDGSKLYAGLNDGSGGVLTIDTRTGERPHELRLSARLNSAAGEWAYMTDVVGDSLLITIGTPEGDDHATFRRVWLNDDGQIAADRRIARAVEIGGARYAVNEAGTRFFTLDENNRVRREYSINRPELRARPSFSEELMVYGLSASPDGRYIVMLVGTPHGC